MTTVKVKPHVSEMLDKLAEKRKEENSFVKSKMDIVEQAVTALYKREIKQ